ncbi:MAG: DUF211 domain-containing protein [Halobacteriaceae archaeon]
MAETKRLILDILKPHEPELPEFVGALADADSVDAVNASLLEIDREVQNVKLTIAGDDVDFHELESLVGELGGTIHSVDRVVCGEYVVEERATPQD